ncbi:hypothetical protein L227DRAFT_608574 [Lentinus tigrinus ALCF2SS1-6]|uniref:DUF6534 domain-containing protein n=1 Tax=Lentinus tigrinus ALCF2SS1-6 TaxID=1328759 RepID=A0A5C2SJD5_9APHY|nr:hypothetical protein L227DRAFT_608574 [Lentinus tigrinus ALCF2SS1-6]
MDPSSASSPAVMLSSSPTIQELQSLLYKTDGAMLLAGFVSTLLYGVVLHQAYRYVRIFPKDVLFIRLLVPVVIVIETLYTACLIHYSYYDFVINYANPEQIFEHISWSGNASLFLSLATTPLTDVHATLQLLPLLGIITGSVTHIFFIRRVSMIGTYHRWLAIFAVIFHVVQNTFGMIITVRGFIFHDAQAYTTKKYLMGLCFGFAVLADISITGALLGVLYKGRARQRRDRPLWDTITTYFVNTGSLVLILDIVTLVLAMASEGNLYWAAINTITTRIYTTTLLSVLNSRNIEAADGIEIFSGGPLRSIARARRLAEIRQWNVPEEPEQTPAKIAINVQTENEGESVTMSRNESRKDLSNDMRYTQIILSVLAAAATVVALPSDTVAARSVEPVEYMAFSKTNGRISATEGSPNGLYMLHNDTHAAYFGEVSADQLAFAHSLVARSADEFTCVPSCNGQQHSASDISTAEQGLQGWFGGGLSWRGSIYYLYNSVYAFGCDYGNGQTGKSSDYAAAYACVDRNCGNTQGGWDSIHNWKVTYGREFGSFGC